jgi:hypothetical protein
VLLLCGSAVQGTDERQNVVMPISATDRHCAKWSTEILLSEWQTDHQRAPTLTTASSYLDKPDVFELPEY